MAPFRFKAPLSPNMAAEREGRVLDFEALISTCRAACGSDRLTLIEGIGGVMVPLDGQRTVLDLIAALALPVVLVSGTGLGALSHCLTAYDALRTRGATPIIVVLNESAHASVPLDATRQTIAGFCAGSQVALVPRDADDMVFDALLPLLAS